MTEVEQLRLLNREGYYRTDVENLFLLEMAMADRVDSILDEADLEYSFGEDELKLFDATDFGDGEEMTQTISPDDISAVDLF